MRRAGRALRLIAGQSEAKLLGELVVIASVHVIEYTAAGHLDLRQAEVDGHRLRDVKEASVGAEREREPVEALQDVRPLVLVEQLHLDVVHRQAVIRHQLVQRLLLVVQLIVLLVSRASCSTKTKSEHSNCTPRQTAYTTLKCTLPPPYYR